MSPRGYKTNKGIKMGPCRAFTRLPDSHKTPFRRSQIVETVPLLLAGLLDDSLASALLYFFSS